MLAQRDDARALVEGRAVGPRAPQPDRHLDEDPGALALRGRALALPTRRLVDEAGDPVPLAALEARLSACGCVISRPPGPDRDS